MTLELLKIAIMKEVDKPPIADQSELRLVGGDAETLNLLWVVAETEAPLAALPVPREIYEQPPATWTPGRRCGRNLTGNCWSI